MDWAIRRKVKTQLTNKRNSTLSRFANFVTGSNIPVPDDELAAIPYFKPAEDSPEMVYLHERRKELGGYLPKRRTKADET